MKVNVKEDKFAESKRILLDLNSAKNEDVVLKILNRDKTKHAKVIDFICDAVRSFGENNINTNLDMNNIENIIEKMMDERFKNMNITNAEKEKVIESLEDNINNVDCEED